MTVHQVNKYGRLTIEKQKIELQCLECEKQFTRVLGPHSYDKVICPRCKSTDIDLGKY